MESRDCYFSFGDLHPESANMTAVAVPYRIYKNKYRDHKQVEGSYNSDKKTIELWFSQEEFKANFGNRYNMDCFDILLEKDGDVICGYFTAKNAGNAMKNAIRYAKREGYKVLCAVAPDKNRDSYGYDVKDSCFISL